MDQKEEPTKQPKKSQPALEINGLVPGLEEMVDAGVHFGHHPSKWNPKMKPYIFGLRNGLYIIDLEKTQQKLKEALLFIKQIKEKKGVLLFVGTKFSAKEAIRQTAEACQMPYVNERWIGGTLTNFAQLSKRLAYFRDLEEQKKSGQLKRYTKKEQHRLDLELEKLKTKFGGIKKMTQLPEALFVASVKADYLAVVEAKKKKIPIIGITDVNGDPAIDYPIPANDEAISSVRLILEKVGQLFKD